MGIFSRRSSYNNPFKRHDKVLAAYDLPGVPERTPGVVKLVNGFQWRRYLVFFDNGVQLGSLDRSALVRPKHWQRWLKDRETLAEQIAARIQAEAAEQETLLASLNAPEAEREAAAEAEPAAGSEPAAEAAADTSSAGGDPDKDRLLAMLPEHLRERSQLARARLGG